VNCLACPDPAEREYAFSFERRNGEVRDVTAPLCVRCAEDLFARDWVTNHAAPVAED
jgi:hypothetical protein